jgi:hypothetical protein
MFALVFVSARTRGRAVASADCDTGGSLVEVDRQICLEAHRAGVRVQARWGCSPAPAQHAREVQAGGEESVGEMRRYFGQAPRRVLGRRGTHVEGCSRRHGLHRKCVLSDCGVWSVD